MPHFGQIKPGAEPDDAEFLLAHRAFLPHAFPATSALAVDDASLTLSQRAYAARLTPSAAATATAAALDILQVQVFGA